MKRGEKDGEKEQVWRERVGRWREQGGTVRGFCRKEGLQESAFYFWRRELGRREQKKVTGKGERDGELSADERPIFLPLKVVGGRGQPLLEISEGERVWRVFEGCTAELLRAARSAWGAAGC